MALVVMAPQQSRPLLELMGSLLEVCMTVVRVAMRLAPYAVFGLMTQLATKIGLEALLGMAVYVGTVLFGLSLLLCFYLLVVILIGRINPLQFLGAAREVMLLAFSTSSSAAVLPLTMKTAQEKLGIRSSVSQFVVPLGATINMDGTALYQGVAAIFLAQVFGVDIGTGGLLLIIITAVGASIGAPATPGVGIVILALVLESVNIPVAGIALILGVDRMLDMSRTSINVCGDLVASKVMDRWLPEESQPEPAAATATLEAIRQIMENFPGVHTVCGLTNVSYGLPERKLINRAFLAAAITCGLDAAILDPTDNRLLAALKAALAVNGRDKFCMDYLTAYREGKLQ